MGNFGDKRNAEGYYDPTPYQAIKGMIKPGEVWEIRDKNGESTEVLVIAVNGDICNIVYLRDEYKPDCIECVGSDVKWINPRMLNWTWAKLMTKFIRKLSDQEFDQILAEVEKVLAVKIGKEADCMANPDPAASRELAEMKHELDAMRCRAKEADCMAAKYAEACKLAEAKATKMEVQLEMMKEMYADLMNKFLQKV